MLRRTRLKVFVGVSLVLLVAGAPLAMADEPRPLAPELGPVLEFNVGAKIAHFCFVPFTVKGQRCFLAVHSACATVDPFHRMFFLPTDTLKLTAFDARGKRLWHRDLGRGVIPGIWFCPVLPFDRDGDGTDEIYLVHNPDADHALDYQSYVLQWLAGATGEPAGERPWPRVDPDQRMAYLYRNFIVAGYSKGQPRLVTAQGTYGAIQLQGFNRELKGIWTRRIEKDDPGARGSHMCPVLDLDGDGRDELLYGERCIDLDTGKDRWVADAEKWSGHSDVVQPTLDRTRNEWLVYTCRETDPPERGVVMFDSKGRELWGHRRMGHMDMGWTARLAEDGRHCCYALEIGSKTAGPGGFKRAGLVEYFYDASGKTLPATFPLYSTLPVDFDGDGLHELAYTGGEHAGLVIDRHGQPIARLAGHSAYGGKLLDRPGEQIVTTDPQGIIRIYACPWAKDTLSAQARYTHPYYASCLRLWAVGFNRYNLGGL